MKPAAPATGFARLSPAAARSVLLVFVLTIAFCIAITLSPMASGFADKPHRSASDVQLYLAEIQRVADGEGYYHATSQELHARGYPTRSVFNWRTPLPMWLLGVLPGAATGRVIIGLLAAVLLGLLVHLTARETTWLRALLCGLLLIGGLMPCWLDSIYVMPEVWAGVLIGLSIAAYGIDRPGWGVALGLSAIFVRELAAPYCTVCLLMAIANRRWRESLCWTVGFSLYAAFYFWHAVQVLQLIQPGDRAHAEGWLQFGGAPFLISLAQMNAFLLLLPQWITAIFLPLCILGLTSWNSPTGKRTALAACTFVIFFAFIGQPFNQYWGSLLAPILCLGFAQSPSALVDLAHRSRLSGKLCAAAGANI